MGHLFIEILLNSILITGLVVIMMMMIESLNIESKGGLFKGLRSSRIGQVVVGALLGTIPGCMGGFAAVSLYTHGMMSFGALVAMMIATSGDESFIMLAIVPDKALLIFTIIFIIAIVAGILTDIVHGRLHRKHCSNASHENCLDEASCADGYSIHSEDSNGDSHKILSKETKRHLSWKRVAMFIGVAVFIMALAGGFLEHEHGHEAESELAINLLNEDWMNILFAVLSLTILGILILGSDHFVEEHLWNHVVKKHLPGIFAWTFGVLAVIGVRMHYINIEDWISGNTALMILMAVAVGIIPESGPHLIFVTLYAVGVVPLPVLIASCISQDGHAALPLLAESKSAFLKAKAINCLVALVAGFGAMAFM